MNNNIRKIKGIFPRGAIWFHGSIIDEIKDLKSENNCHNMFVEWQIYETKTQGTFMKSNCILKSLFDSESNLIENIYNIVDIENIIVKNKMISINLKHSQMYNDKIEYEYMEEVETNFNNVNYPFIWNIVNFIDKVNDGYVKVLDNGKEIIVKKYEIRKKGINKQNVSDEFDYYEQEDEHNDSDCSSVSSIEKHVNFEKKEKIIKKEKNNNFDNENNKKRVNDYTNEIYLSRQNYQYSTPNTELNVLQKKQFLTNNDDDNFSNDETSSDLSGNIFDSSGNPIIMFRKYTYREIEKEINDNYFDNKEYYSSALDILATYLRGQKLIYMESKSYCENRLNFLMMPSILLSTTATVLATILNQYIWELI